MDNSLTTNIIRNVYNIGTNSCDAGTQYCADGYALYFPCLKDITKGQNVCFDFYVADYAGKNAYDIAAANAANNQNGSNGNGDGTDGTGSTPNANQELADLRDVDALSLNLIGAFNCPYGTFSYPDNISSLQTEEYPPVYRLDFGERKLCHLSVFMIDTENTSSDPYYNTQEGDFYSGTTIEVEANDTPTHIFLGWAFLNTNEDEEECADETWEENIINRDNIYRFVIQEDTIVLALYRPRKLFHIVSDPTNRSSHFVIDYDHVEYHISNRKDDTFDDKETIPYDTLIDVLEGYHMVAKCIPSTDVIGSDPDESFRFVEWKDKDKNRCRLFIIGEDTQPFLDSDKVTIKLKAKCNGPFPYEELEDEDIIYMDEFDEEGIHINTEFNEVDIFDYYGDGQYVISADEAYQKFIGEEGYLYLHFGTIELSSAGIEDGIKFNLHAKADGYCELHITINGFSTSLEVAQDEFKLYEIYFSKCNKSNIQITAYGDCLIDMIEVCKEEIIDKGKAQLCLPPEVTENLPSGPLSVNGAIMVNGKSYGLAQTTIGSVNKLPKITINS